MAKKDTNNRRKRLLPRPHISPERLLPREQVELLLSFSLRRRDIKQLSEKLIQQFENRRGVLDADYESLISIEGISKRTATLIMLTGEMARGYDSDLSADAQWQLTYDRVGTYAAEQIGRMRTECVLIVCLDAKFRILRKKLIEEGTAASVLVMKRGIVKIALECNAASVLIAHNHPRGTPIPSRTDIAGAGRIKKILEELKISLYDFVIVGDGGETYSVLRSGLI